MGAVSFINGVENGGMHVRIRSNDIDRGRHNRGDHVHIRCGRLDPLESIADHGAGVGGRPKPPSNI